MIDSLSDLVSPVRGAQYGVAVFGSLAVELAALLRELSDQDGKLPKRYRSWSYPVVRVIFAFVAAGPLAVLLGIGAVAFDASVAMSAFYVGVSAPLIFDRAAAGTNANDDGSGEG